MTDMNLITDRYWILPSTLMCLKKGNKKIVAVQVKSIFGLSFVPVTLSLREATRVMNEIPNIQFV